VIFGLLHNSILNLQVPSNKEKGKTIRKYTLKATGRRPLFGLTPKCGPCGTGSGVSRPAQLAHCAREVALLQKSPRIIGLLRGASASYCTRDALCTKHPQKQFLLPEPVPDTPVPAGAVLPSIWGPLCPHLEVEHHLRLKR
jgi:hypothetical protein